MRGAGARAITVVVLVILQVVFSALQLLGGLAFYVVLPPLLHRPIPGLLFSFGKLVVLGSVSVWAAALFLLGAVGFMVALGLWMRLRWAWTAALALALIGLAIGVMDIPRGLFDITINGAIVYCLQRPRIKAFYRRS